MNIKYTNPVFLNLSWIQIYVSISDKLLSVNKEVLVSYEQTIFIASPNVKNYHNDTL